MRVLVTSAALALVALIAGPSAQAGEAPETAAGDSDAAGGKPTVAVVVTLKGGGKEEGTLLEGWKDGTIRYKTPYGERTLPRGDWVQVKAKKRLPKFALADSMLRTKRYDAASKKYQEAHDTYKHLHIFGAEALDGKGQALIKLKEYKRALAVYGQLFREYSGADLSHSRRYRHAVCLGKVGGRANREKAIGELERVIAVTDEVVTVRSLYQLGQIHYGNKKYYLALRSYMKLFILYRNYPGESAREVQALVKSARNNAISCCKKLMSSSNASIKKRAEKIKAGLERAR